VNITNITIISTIKTIETMPGLITYDLDDIDFSSEFVFEVSGLTRKTVTGYERNTFLHEFWKKHPTTDSASLMTVLIDASRCLFGPNVQNWPGATIKVGNFVKTDADRFVVKLEAGKSTLKEFNQNDRGVYSWSHCCMAFCGIFCEIWRKAAPVMVKEIPGSYDGYTTYCSTLKGFSERDYDNCVTAMDQFVGSNKLKKRDADMKAKVKRAVMQTVATRNIKTNQALTLRQMIIFYADGDYDKLPDIEREVTKESTAIVPVSGDGDGDDPNTEEDGGRETGDRETTD
jgi:hypothetical protein